MEKAVNDLKALYAEARKSSEFDFVLTLINYRGIGSHKLTTNLHEWFDSIEFYKTLFDSHDGKEKTRVGALLYSMFFENSDFYNIIGSLCKVKLGYKGSSYLFWKTKKNERLLGIGEKQDYLIELLEDAGKSGIVEFFENNHFREIRNTFFHSAYSLSEEDYLLHDSDPIEIDGIGRHDFNVKKFFYPRIANVYDFFQIFKNLYLESFDSYKEEFVVNGLFPNPVEVTILGSPQGLKGFRIKNSVQIFGEWHDSGIMYQEKYDMWAGLNINMYFANVETIEIRESLSRYETKNDINKNDAEFLNLVDKIVERKIPTEIYRATNLLIKFGNVRYDKMKAEKNPFKRANFPKVILPHYRRAADIGSLIGDTTKIKERIKELEGTGV